mgnify:CR=1 FL=1
MSNLTKNLQEGWEERNGIRRTTQINPGELSLLLKSEFKDRLKFNLLTLKPELDGVQLPEKFVTYFYVRMGEIGWRIGRESARDGLIYASQQFAYDPVVEYLQEVIKQVGQRNFQIKNANNLQTKIIVRNSFIVFGQNVLRTHKTKRRRPRDLQAHKIAALL